MLQLCSFQLVYSQFRHTPNLENRKCSNQASSELSQLCQSPVWKKSNTCTYSDDKNPFDQGEAEATDGSVAPCDGIGQTEGQAEPDPVEQEGHWWRNIGQDFSNNQKKRYDLI